ncbi:WD40 repeat domain-containing protein [Mucisphaera calidilacus]|uniref:Outer membrane protein assembly factor BamB n=1 Tax=Mucisphaera calidilacus TaxID=2527982 RepID=A0A518BWY4_9BACT|nr:hypothetical protein [Mucisphaera calidilacus]QDU71489.1 Outer membrane protein assembly factor BamB [Mucisphaera calidilacus]
MADLMGEYGSVESAEFSRDSAYIVTGTKYDNTVRVFRTADGVMQWQTRLPAEIERVAWTGDGRRVVSVSEDHQMRVIDAGTGEVLRAFRHRAGIDSLALSHDGTIMAMGEESLHDSDPDSEPTAEVVLYNTETWEEIGRVFQGSTANEISFSPDDAYFVVVGGAHMKAWDTATRSLRYQNEVFYDSEYPQWSRFICVKISPDGRYVVVGANHGWLYFYHASTGEYIRRLNKTGDKIETVEWTADSRYVLSAGKVNVIDFIATRHALDTALNNRSVPIALRVPLTDHLEYMHFNASGALLTTAHQDGTVQLWTYMADNPGINQRSHAGLSAQQEADFDRR